MISRFWKPWFVYRPSQLVRRAVCSILPGRRGVRPLRTSWGATVLADPKKTIGRCIRTTGLYDLSVSELLARLVDPGAVVVDAGANVGYMSVLLGYLAGQGGRVLSFEPHPELFQVLSENCQLAKASGVSASFELHSVALGTEPGTAELLLPAEFDSNDGTARIRTDSSSTERAISVPITTLNEVVGSASVDLMKLDVEGYELAVLQGAKKLLTENRLRHLVFEEHQIEGSEVVRFLQECGFSIFSLGWTMNRLSIQPVAVGNLATSYEAPSFVATRDAETLLARSQPSGWKVLRPIRVPRGSK